MAYSSKNGKASAERGDVSSGEMAMSMKGVRLLLAGLLVMIAGYILMCGGGSDDPEVFNYAMFDFRRLVAAPVAIIAGTVIEIVSIMKIFSK